MSTSPDIQEFCIPSLLGAATMAGGVAGPRDGLIPVGTVYPDRCFPESTPSVAGGAAGAPLPHLPANRAPGVSFTTVADFVRVALL